MSEKTNRAVAAASRINARRASLFCFSGEFFFAIGDRSRDESILGSGPAASQAAPVRGPLRLPVWALLAFLLVPGPWGCGKGDAPPGAIAPGAALPAATADGEALYGTHCGRCHGPAGTGTDQGPPLVNRIYEPSHHPDAAFYHAVAQGVRAHHWRFGDMPAVGGLANAQVTAIIAYVRGLQRDAGIH